ncbi:MAG: 2-phospho-L-lactate guanylyltransferase [Variibacter sp.]|nr:2-phospho-L-lactate guanylyltransferase [Variibacter sp.]
MTGAVWAVLPVKEVANAKQRLGSALPRDLRRRLALAMMEDVLATLAAVPVLDGIAVVTVDPAAETIGRRYEARIIAEGARDGHTGAVRAAADVLARDGVAAMLQVPGDIPLATADEITRVVRARANSDFVIVPSHDGRGSNAVLCAPPLRVPLQFGDDSFLPHLDAARRCGIEPHILRMPGVGADIDQPGDLAAFMRMPSATRTYALLREHGLVGA